jgi:hypothetical protein
MDELCDRFLTLKAEYKEADANAKARPTKAYKKMADTLVWNMLVSLIQAGYRHGSLS